jgi:hypothetical protein
MSLLENVAEKNLHSEISVSKTYARRAKELCTATIVYTSKEHDMVGKLHFYSQFLQSVNDGEVEPHLVFFFYEA